MGRNMVKALRRAQDELDQAMYEANGDAAALADMIEREVEHTSAFAEVSDRLDGHLRDAARWRAVKDAAERGGKGY